MLITVRWSAEALLSAVPVQGRAVPAAWDLTMQRQDGAPDLVLGIEARGGVPQCRRAELRSSEGGREVLASDLRGVKLEDLLELAVMQVATLLAEERHEGGVVTTLRPVTGEEEVRDALRQTRAARRQARRRVTDELLREVAQVYRDNINDNPTTAVAQHTGRAHRTAALYVQQARQAGYLGAALRAKAGEQQ